MNIPRHIYTVDALAGPGKTYAAVRYALQRALYGDKTVIVFKSKELIAEAFRDIKEERNKPRHKVPLRYIHRDHLGSNCDGQPNTSVKAAILILGHNGFYFKPYLERRVKPAVDKILEYLASGKIPPFKTPEAVAIIQRAIEGGSYFTGLSNIHTSRAYHFGFLHWCEVYRVIYHEWRGFPDDRMCAICLELHGTQFEVQITVDMMYEYLLAKDPEDAKNIFPWPTLKEIKSMSKEALRNSPYRLSPVHPV